jgi:hypothetical protein
MKVLYASEHLLDRSLVGSPAERLLSLRENRAVCGPGLQFGSSLLHGQEIGLAIAGGLAEFEKTQDEPACDVAVTPALV